MSDPTERGRLEIRPRVIEKVASRAASGVPGVVVDWRVRRAMPVVRSRVNGRRARIEVDVAVVWGRPVAAVAKAVQRTVADQVSTYAGMTVVAVDVTVISAVVPGRRQNASVR